MYQKNDLKVSTKRQRQRQHDDTTKRLKLRQTNCQQSAGRSAEIREEKRLEHSQGAEAGRQASAWQPVWDLPQQQQLQTYILVQQQSNRLLINCLFQAKLFLLVHTHTHTHSGTWRQQNIQSCVCLFMLQVHAATTTARTTTTTTATATCECFSSSTESTQCVCGLHSDPARFPFLALLRSSQSCQRHVNCHQYFSINCIWCCLTLPPSLSISICVALASTA